MHNIAISARDLRKDFNRMPVFSGVSFDLGRGETLAVSGRNGSGKSTLLKIVASLLSPTSGTVSMIADGSPVPGRFMFRHIGMVAPYLQVYEEFTALENLSIIDRIRGGSHTAADYERLLSMVSLGKRKHDHVRTFSSGMKQRLKYALAWMERPALLLLDEPRTNLDAEGIAMMLTLFEDQRREGMVIIATNEQEDVDICASRISLGYDGAAKGGGS
ncbi:MAG TPA: ABC transporter ATP-binding protein [Bacteroidota bacterium]|nr:ABC transporter ATP-binding protein [Bacteroidota bacterium]